MPNKDIVYMDFNESHRQQVETQFLQLVSHVAQFNPLRKKQADPTFATTYLNTFLLKTKENKAVIKIAIENNQVVGFAIGVIKEKEANELLEFLPVKIGFISDLYIDPNYRTRGIGSALVNEIEKYFKTHACIISEINVAIENTNAHKLYKALGYRDNDVNLRKSIA